MIVSDSNYIVASNKTWHFPVFKEVSCVEKGNWFYVSTQEELISLVNEIVPRYIFFLHWSWKVPQDIWEVYECVCFHMTDVPYGRGGSPLQNLILEGNEKTMLTALRMEEEMDAGPVYAKRFLNLDGRAEDIYLRAGAISWEIVQWIVGNEPVPEPQIGEAKQFQRRKPEQSSLPESGSLKNIYDFIRMLDAPTYPLAFFEYGEFRLEFSHAQLGESEIHAKVVIRKNSINE